MKNRMDVIDLNTTKKEAKKKLDKTFWKLLLCYVIYFFILMSCFSFCIFVPNPLENLLKIELSKTKLFTEILNDDWLKWGTFAIYKFLRSILFFALAYPFTVCMAKIPVLICRNEKITGKEAFSPIKSARYFIEYMIAGAVKFLAVFAWFILLIFPGIIAHYRYSLLKYIFQDDFELTSSEAFAKSKKLVQGYKNQLFKLDLSFLGWFFFGICTCGIGMLYVVCYYSVVKAIYYQKIYENENSVIKENSLSLIENIEIKLEENMKNEK